MKPLPLGYALLPGHAREIKQRSNKKKAKAKCIPSNVFEQPQQANHHITHTRSYLPLSPDDEFLQFLLGEDGGLGPDLASR